MYLIQILLPITAPQRATYQHHYRALREELIARFGGLTAHTRAPAEGLWNPGPDQDAHAPDRDDIVILEVVAQSLDRAWWRSLRARLERELMQQEIHMRAIEVEQL